MKLDESYFSNTELDDEADIALDDSGESLDGKSMDGYDYLVFCQFCSFNKTKSDDWYYERLIKLQDIFARYISSSRMFSKSSADDNFFVWYGNLYASSSDELRSTYQSDGMQAVKTAWTLCKKMEIAPGLVSLWTDPNDPYQPNLSSQIRRGWSVGFPFGFSISNKKYISDARSILNVFEFIMRSMILAVKQAFGSYAKAEEVTYGKSTLKRAQSGLLSQNPQEYRSKIINIIKFFWPGTTYKEAGLPNSMQMWNDMVSSNDTPPELGRLLQYMKIPTTLKKDIDTENKICTVHVPDEVKLRLDASYLEQTWNLDREYKDYVPYIRRTAEGWKVRPDGGVLELVSSIRGSSENVFTLTYVLKNVLKGCSFKMIVLNIELGQQAIGRIAKMSDDGNTVNLNLRIVKPEYKCPDENITLKLNWKRDFSYRCEYSRIKNNPEYKYKARVVMPDGSVYEEDVKYKYYEDDYRRGW